MSDKTDVRKAQCRHCEEPLVEVPNLGEGTWKSANTGLRDCCGMVYGSTIPHMPMPEGFRGAPR